MKYGNTFTILALLLLLVFYLVVYLNMQVPIYPAWLVSASLTAFIMYGLDKYLAKIRRWEIRVPELILHLLALAGGFLGGWLGMVIWRHKMNFRKHWGIYAVLVASTLLHAAVVYLYITYVGGVSF